MTQFSAPTLQKIQDVTVASIAFGLKDKDIMISNLCLLLSYLCFINVAEMVIIYDYLVGWEKLVSISDRLPSPNIDRCLFFMNNNWMRQFGF